MTTTSGPIQFDFGALLKQAWKLYIENIGIMLGAFALFTLIELVGIWFCYGIIHIVVAGPLALGLAGLVLKTVRHQHMEFGEFFGGFQNFLPSFMASLLIFVFVSIGLVFCFLPGLFVVALYMLTFFFMHDEKLDFWPAMEHSRIVVMENVEHFLLLFLVIFALNLAGIISCGFGFLVSGPVTALMLALAYEQVRDRAPAL